MTAIPAMTPSYRVLLGDVHHFRILLVGCGGTGSQLAPALAGLAYHAAERGVSVELTFVDPDMVEEVNVGRQNFCPAELGYAKCATLALRLNAAYGLVITAWQRLFTAEMGLGWWREGERGYGRECRHLLIGCVDNHLARRELAEVVNQARGKVWAIECGNDLNNGQVLIGNQTDVRQIRLDPLGLCSALPSPYLQEPTLLEPESLPHPASCAELSQQETQGLMVNRMTAAIAAQYVADFVLQRQVTSLGTVFNLTPAVMQSRLITQESLLNTEKVC